MRDPILYEPSDDDAFSAATRAYVVSHLLHTANSPASDRPYSGTVIELAARDFEMLDELETSCPDALFVGVELEDVNLCDVLGRESLDLGSEFEEAGAEDPYDIPDEPHPSDIAWEYDSLLKKMQGCHVPADHIKYLKDDIFLCAGKVDSLAASDERRVFSRVPANKPRTRLTGSLDAARSICDEVLGADITMTEWMYAAAAALIMGADGRAVLQLPLRALSLGLGRHDRQAFLSKGLIEMVVALPKGFDPSDAALGSALVVLSHKNTAVRFVDARATERDSSALRGDSVIPGSALEPNAIDGIAGRIVELIRDTSAESRLVEQDTIEGNEWNLSPLAYCGAASVTENDVRLGDITDVRRGISKKTVDELAPLAAIRRDVLEQAAAEAGSDNDPEDLEWEWLRSRAVAGEMLYLSSKDFEDGEIFDSWSKIGPGRNVNVYELTCADDLERLGLMQGTRVLISRSSPFKVALWEDRAPDNEIDIQWLGLTGKPRLAISENLFALDVQDNVNPLYILAYLRSDAGQKTLEGNAFGTSSLHARQLSAPTLREIRIPLPSREKQDKIADEYIAGRNMVVELQEKLRKAEERLRKPTWC